MKKFNSSLFKKIFTYVCLCAYIILAGVLILEASIDGTSSANQSNSIGNNIVDIINKGNTDFSTTVIPKKTIIKNKIEKAYVGETYQLETIVEPENATFKSIVYSSSSSSVTVSQSGMISFLKEGEAKIYARNSSYASLVDSFIVKILPVNVDHYDVEINYVDKITETTLQPIDLKYYNLYVDTNYNIKISALPENATNKSYKITSSSTNFKISNNQVIPLKTSSIYESVKITGEKEQEFFIKIIDNPHTFVPFISLDFVDIKECSYVIGYQYRTTHQTLKPLYNNGLSIPTYNEVAYESLDESILKINNNSMCLLKEGSTFIKMYSVYYPDIYVTKKVTAYYLKLNKFSLLLNGKNSNVTMYQNTSSKLKLSSFTPSSFTYKSKIDDQNYFTKVFSSSNPDVANVDSEGVVNAKSFGTATIYLTLTDTKGNIITSSIDVTVEKLQPSKPIDYTITKINYSHSLNECEVENNPDNYIYGFKTYNFDDYFKIDSIEGDNVEKAPRDKKIFINSLYSSQTEMYINEEDYKNYLEINGNTYRFLRSCVVDFYFVHTESNFPTYFNDDSFKFHVIFIPTKPDIQINGYTPPSIPVYEDINEDYTINMQVGNSYYLSFFAYYNISYNQSNKMIKHSYLQYYTTESKMPVYVFEIQALKPGTLKFTLTAKSGNKVVNNSKARRTITFNIGVKIKDFDLNLYKKDEIITTTKINENHEPVYERYVGEKLDVKYTYSYDEIPTAINTEISSYNKDVLKVNGNSILMKNAGKSLITFKEAYSNIEKTIQINSYNIIKINPNNSVVLIGKYVSKDEDGTIHLYAAKSIKLKLNFYTDSSYKKIKYTSTEDSKKLEDKFFDLGQDGTVTAIQKGKGEVRLTVDDNFTPFDEETNNGSRTVIVPIQIDPTPLINEDNISHILLLIRKSLGHFGAFLVFGIFSTFFYLFQFDKKKWFFSVPVNFLQGLALATLTELIQVFVPGRGGLVRDVKIDFLGFFVAALIITIGIIAIYFIKKAKQNKKQKNNKI